VLLGDRNSLHSLLETLWQASFLPCKAASTRLTHEIPKALEDVFKCFVLLSEGEDFVTNFKAKTAEVLEWGKQNELGQQTGHIDNFGVACQVDGTSRQELNG
jgi:hypothetical protein